MAIVRAVLVRPETVNVGAVARVVRNTGLQGIDLVAPGDWRTVEAWRTAWKAHDVLEEVRGFERREPALADAADVLYEMLAGQKPFSGASPAVVLAQQLSRQPPPIRETCPDVPPSLATVVDSMTALTPDARPGSYPDLLRSLTPDGALPVEPESATSTMAALPKAAARTPSRVAVYRRWAAAAALVAAAAAGMALVAHPTPRRHGSFAVAVAPFYGADAESEKEGRVVATLVESELLLRLPEDDVDVLGVAQVGQVVRSPRAARALAEKLAVDVVVWGEAVAFQGQVELATRWTPRRGEVAGSAALRETLGTAAANAIEVRRARAAAVADGVAQLYASR